MFWVFRMKDPGTKAVPGVPVRAVVRANGMFQARNTFQSKLDTARSEGSPRLEAGADYELTEIPVHGAPTMLVAEYWEGT